MIKTQNAKYKKALAEEAQENFEKGVRLLQAAWYNPFHHVRAKPVCLTHIHKITPRGSSRSHKFLWARSNDPVYLHGPEIAQQEINQIFRVK